MIKILVAGNWRADIHEESLCRAFEELGCEVIRFKWNSYFKSRHILLNFFRKLEYKFFFGPSFKRCMSDLVKVAGDTSPDLIFIYRPIIISKSTLGKIRRVAPNATIASYNNDNPFGHGYSFFYWKKHLDSISHYDVVYAYRPANVEQYRSINAQRVELLPPWFVKEKIYPRVLVGEDRDRFCSDVVFIAHYEMTDG